MVKAFPDPIPLPGRKNHSLKIFDHCLPHLLIMLAVKLQYSRVPWIKHKNKTNLRISSSQGIRKVPRVWPSHSFMTLIIFGMQLPCSSTGMRLHIWACRPVGTCDYKLEDPPPGTPRILCFYYLILHCQAPTNVLFLCDTNIRYVVTFAIENIRTKAHQCFETCKNYDV